MSQKGRPKYYAMTNRRLNILRHLFGDLYRPLNSKKSVEEYRAEVNHQFPDSSKRFGPSPLPEYLRYNDVQGIRYKGEWFFDGKKYAELSDDTVRKMLDSWVKAGILVKGKRNNVKAIKLYFPNESYEGMDNLVEYLAQFKIDSGDMFDEMCKWLAHDSYSRVVLNRGYVLHCFQKKGITLKLNLEDKGNPNGFRIIDVPYVGRFRKYFENPKPLESMISTCEEVI